MCNIWKTAREVKDIQSRELSREEIVSLLSGPLFSELVELDLTGGETNLRDDLADIVIDVSKLKNKNLKKLESIIVTSNGFLTGKVVSNYRKIAAAIKDTGIDLVSVLSLDGIGETHDLVRGTRGAYDMVLKTIDGLIELRKEYPHFIIGIKTTILPQNYDKLDPILDFALDKGLFHIISPVLFTEGRFRNLEQTQGLKLGPDHCKEISRFYNRPELRKSYFYSLERSFLNSGRKHWMCAASYNYLYVDYEGKVYPCELIQNRSEILKKQSVEDIFKISCPSLAKKDQ
jgi:MoaA/NifB/PqqE/SkfB family radical SAM enzyme